MGGAFALFLIAIIARLIYLQIIKHDDFLSMAEKQHQKSIQIVPLRGTIFDRNMRELAVSIYLDSVYAIPSQVNDPDRIASIIAPIIKESLVELKKKLRSDKSFVWLKRRIEPSISRELKALNIQGVGFIKESKRFYPNRELAAHVVGVVGLDNDGLEGAELKYNNYLKGKPGLALIGRDALGREVFSGSDYLKPPEPGKDIVLTVDATIQYIVERELDRVFQQTRAKGAVAIVINPITGEILAMTSRPTFNPNNFEAFDAAQMRNRAITDTFEPGSTFKVIIAAGLLNENLARPTDKFYGEWGAITIYGRVIHDWKKYGWLTFQEALQFSSNVCAIKLGMLLGRDRSYKYITDFGFGSLTGIDLQGEVKGLVRPPKLWSGTSLASISIGQEISVTGVQILNAISAVANGGKVMRPYIIKAIKDPGGVKTREFYPHVIRQVISEKSSKELIEILKAVVRDGTGKKAGVDGFDVGGKTGTAQKQDPHTKLYSRSPGVLSFVGFVPADNPRMAAIVLLDEPKDVQWGSEAAAPIFSHIGKQVLSYMAITPRDMPSLEIVHKASLSQKEEVRNISLESSHINSIQSMPNLVGKSLRQALDEIAHLNVKIEVKGSGIVIHQDPLPGEDIAQQTVCRLELSKPSKVR